MPKSVDKTDQEQLEIAQSRHKFLIILMMLSVVMVVLDLF